MTPIDHNTAGAHNQRDAAYSIGIDVGGTNLRAAVVQLPATPGAAPRIVDVEKRPTPSTTTALEAAIAHAVDTLRERTPQVSAVGLAIAGFLSPDQQTIRFAPHLPWRDANVARTLTHRIGLPVSVEHDANAAALGEYHSGAAQGVDNWVLFAIGTGVGGALMNQGHIYRGAFGTAPEFGHLTVVPEGRCCPCGKRGCLERYVSGSALALTAQDLIATGSFPDSTLSRHYARQPETITGRMVVDAARRRDSLAAAALKDFGEWLGRGLAMVQDVYDPELIVVGGGVSSDADLYLDHALQIRDQEVTGAGHRPVARVVPADLGEDAGMIGVAILAAETIGSATQSIPTTPATQAARATPVEPDVQSSAGHSQPQRLSII